jgi:hypothetical protein
MGTFTAGQVVIVHFPFSNLTASKLRPAVVLAEAGRGDWILARSPANPTATKKPSLSMHPTSHAARFACPPQKGRFEGVPRRIWTGHSRTAWKNVSRDMSWNLTFKAG